MIKTTTYRLTRRAMMTGLAAAVASAASAGPDRTLRPIARSLPAAGVGTAVAPNARPVSRLGATELIRAAGLDGQVGFVIADVDTGEILEQVDGSQGRPPASVTKALTALYALETLGADYRFVTRLLATGPVNDGQLDGDLILVGGGDPALVTDDLAVLAQQISELGITSVRGTFQVWGGALPGVKEIEPGQLDQLDYNPSLGGLNLNFNRVFFEWARNGADYTVSMDARSETRRPAVRVARMKVVERSVPVYTYAEGPEIDEWTVAKGALGKAGSRWLPVRFPALYAGDVFRTLAQDVGVTLPAAQSVIAVPDGQELARYESAPLQEMMRTMLLYSTNLTAEATGMTATAHRAGAARGLRTSAMGMADWFRTRAGIVPHLEDHSGLSDANRISGQDMVALLNAQGAQSLLMPIMKTITMVDNDRKAIPNFPAEVRAKTGTLNFVSTLAGYLRTESGRTLSFAIFAYDPEARAVSLISLDEKPRGASGFNGRAKRLQQALLQRWAVLGDING